MKDLNYDLKKLCHRYREGSFATYADRERILDLIANQLQNLGFKALRAINLKPRHVDALVAHWHKESISAGTFKKWNGRPSPPRAQHESSATPITYSDKGIACRLVMVLDRWWTLTGRRHRVPKVEESKFFTSKPEGPR